MSDILEEKWERIVDFLSSKFAEGDEKLELQGILFIIGMQESRQGYRNFSKQEKMDIIHVGICKLMSYEGYFTFSHVDDDGWPHYKPNEERPAMSPKKQAETLKAGVVRYFEEQNVSLD